MKKVALLLFSGLYTLSLFSMKNGDFKDLQVVTNKKTIKKLDNPTISQIEQFPFDKKPVIVWHPHENYFAIYDVKTIRGWHEHEYGYTRFDETELQISGRAIKWFPDSYTLPYKDLIDPIKTFADNGFGSNVADFFDKDNDTRMMCQSILEYDSPITLFRSSPNKNHLVTVSEKNELAIWKSIEKKWVCVQKPVMPTVITCLDFSSDFKYIALGLQDGSLQFYDTITMKKKYRLKVFRKNPILALAFSPHNKKLLISASCNELKCIKIPADWWQDKTMIDSPIVLIPQDCITPQTPIDDD